MQFEEIFMSYIYRSFVIRPSEKQKEKIYKMIEAKELVYGECMSFIEYHKGRGMALDYSEVVSKFYEFVYTRIDRDVAIPMIYFPILHNLYKTLESSKIASKNAKSKNKFLKLNTIPSFSNTHIFIENLGKIRWLNRSFPKGKIINAYIIEEKGRILKLWILFQVDEKYVSINPEKCIGIDVGLCHYLNLSNGMKIDKPNFLELYKKKITKIKNSLQKKSKNSTNYKKLKEKLDKLYKCSHNKKYHFLHELSSKLVKEYDLICMETLHTSEFTSLGGRKSELWNDASILVFQKMLRYKCALNCKRFILAPKYFPSSQICNNCGYRDRRLKQISIKIYRCKQCKILLDRDLNAARNLRKYGLRQIGMDPY